MSVTFLWGSKRFVCYNLYIWSLTPIFPKECLWKFRVHSILLNITYALVKYHARTNHDKFAIQNYFSKIKTSFDLQDKHFFEFLVCNWLITIKPNWIAATEPETEYISRHTWYPQISIYSDVYVFFTLKGSS